MAGVEQATAPGAPAPDETPKSERRTGRRRASQKAGRQSDSPEADQKPAQHAAGNPDEHDDATTPKAGGPDEPDDAAAPKAGRPERDATTTPNASARTSLTRRRAEGRRAGRARRRGHAEGRQAAHARHDADDGARAKEHADDHADKRADKRADGPADGRANERDDAADAATDNEPGDTVRAAGPAHAGAAGPAHAGAPVYRPRHAKRRRRRWPILVAAGVVLVALTGAGAAALINRQNDQLDDITAPAATGVAPAPANLPAGDASGVPSAGASAPPAAAPGTAPAAAPGTADCRFSLAPDKTPRVVPPGKATRSGLVKVTIGTNRGPITMELDATNAPCTVESFLTLASSGYFDDTACHRLTTMMIFVLQCGDPTATGSGDPGYSFDDENLPAPGGVPYPRGTLAMANAGPDTNGSQFFVVYKDSPIDPNYPVFGKITGGLEIVDKVAAGGAPGSDGQPNESLIIQAVQVS